LVAMPCCPSAPVAASTQTSNITAMALNIIVIVFLCQKWMKVQSKAARRSYMWQPVPFVTLSQQRSTSASDSSHVPHNPHQT
jgi:hypothetical protein